MPLALTPLACTPFAWALAACAFSACSDAGWNALVAPLDGEHVTARHRHVVAARVATGAAPSPRPGRGRVSRFAR